MFTGVLNQGDKNSCGAAVLAIAAHELKKGPTPDIKLVDTLYAKTQDKELSELMKCKDPKEYLSTPSKIIEQAKVLGFHPDLLVTKDIDVPKLNPEIQGFKHKYIDSQGPTTVSNADLLNMIKADSYLEILVYLNGEQDKTHWLLVQSDGTNYYVYDTAYGLNHSITKDELAKLLTFDGKIVTGKGPQARQNNFYGVAIRLH